MQIDGIPRLFLVVFLFVCLSDWRALTNFFQLVQFRVYRYKHAGHTVFFMRQAPVWLLRTVLSAQVCRPAALPASGAASHSLNGTWEAYPSVLHDFLCCEMIENITQQRV